MDQQPVNDLLSQIPSKEWSLEQLGVFVQAMGKKTALDIWRQGRALSFAKGQQKNRRKWEAWCKEHASHLSKSTINRYLEVAQLQLETVEDKTINEVYVILGFKEKKVPEPTPAAPAQPTITADGTPVPPPEDPTPEADVKGQDKETTPEQDKRLAIAGELATRIVTEKKAPYKKMRGVVEFLVEEIVEDRLSTEEIENIIEEHIQEALVHIAASLLGISQS